MDAQGDHMTRYTAPGTTIDHQHEYPAMRTNTDTSQTILDALTPRQREVALLVEQVAAS